jgi:hypothetical protein
MAPSVGLSRWMTSPRSTNILLERGVERADERDAHRD